MKIKLYKRVCFFYQNNIISKKYSASSQENSRIYMFHNVSEKKTSLRDYNSNVKGFEEFIKILLKKYKPSSLIDIIGRNNKSFAISFDDVSISVYYYALPILEKYSIPYTLFVSLNNLNKEGYMSVDLLKELLKSDLCTIGSHTISHTMLRFDKNYKEEIKQSKKELEKLLKCKISLFAYPFGSIYACSKKNIRYAKKSGYLYSFSAINGTLNEKAIKNKQFLPRLNGDIYVNKIERGEKI